MANSEDNSYNSIAKANTLFGGVQVYQILIQILKSKFVALFIGTTGVGIMGLLTTATLLIKNITSMGLSTSAVRDVSEANGAGDDNRVALVVTVLRRLVVYTGLLGTIAVIVLSPVLSFTSFGNYDYTIPFILLSVTLLFDQLSAGRLVILQGLRKYRYLTKASAYGSTAGLVISIPIYYFWGISGIVPTLILTSISQFVLAYLFSLKVPVKKMEVSSSTVIKEGKTMLSMGFFLSLNTVLATGCAFVVKSFINNFGGTDEVGLYTAGVMIVDTYFGLVFSALASDYYPRIAEIGHDNEKCNKIANQQGEIAILFLGPLLAACLIFMPLMVRILYSGSFDAACDFITWASVGVLFRLTSWLISNQFVAKGDIKVFVQTEFTSRVYFLLFNLLLYYVDGLRGLGISCTISYLLFAIQVFIVGRKKYDFRFDSAFLKLFILQVLIIATCLVLILLCGTVMRYTLGTLILALSVYISYIGLDKRIGLNGKLKRLLHR